MRTHREILPEQFRDIKECRSTVLRHSLEMWDKCTNRQFHRQLSHHPSGPRSLVQYDELVFLCNEVSPTISLALS